MLCAVFVSSFSCDVLWRFGVSPSLSSRSSSRLPVSCGRLVAVLSICPSSRLAHQFVRRLVKQFVLVSLGRLAHRLVGRLVLRSGSPSCSSFLGVSPCPAHRFPSRPLVSSARLVKQSAFSRFVWRLVLAARVLSLSPVSSFLFSVSSRSFRLMAMGTGCGLSCPCLVAACLISCLPSVIMGAWRWRKWACRSTIRETRRFPKLDFPIR